MHPDRWEHGSEFHWPIFPPAFGGNIPVWNQGQWFGSGRDGLRALARHGRRENKWHRFWLPAYLCQDLTTALHFEGVEVILYPDLPGTPLRFPEAVAGDAVLVVNTFGLRSGPSPKPPKGVNMIEDHTHDPWSPWASGSTADYCIASLRKTLPIPDGGILWSPAGHPLPERYPVTAQREKASSLKLIAMLLKALYLDGHSVNKEDFRRLACAGEEGIAVGDISAMPESTRTLLSILPAESWRETRRRNFQMLSGALNGVRGIQCLQPDADECVPFATAIVAENPRQRDLLRMGLIKDSIFPAVLWPLDEACSALSPETRDLSHRILTLHCDQRYTEQDMERVAGQVIRLTKASHQTARS